MALTPAGDIRFTEAELAAQRESSLTADNERLRAQLDTCHAEAEKLCADLAAVEAILLRAIPRTDGVGDDPSHVPVVRIAETVVREIGAARKVVEACRAWCCIQGDVSGAFDSILRGEGPVLP